MVPNRCNYADWKGVKGFGLVGDASFFPHMNDTWKSLVKKKVTEDSCSGTVFCLKDEEACCVQGTTRQRHVLVVSKELVITE